MTDERLYVAAIRAGCSHRQAQVLVAYAEGQKLGDAARHLGIAESTAKNHMTAVRRRLGVPHAAAAIRKLLA